MSSRTIITGMGAVSPAGWGVEALVQAVQAGQLLPATVINAERKLSARLVPRPIPNAELIRHPRLRRASPLSHFAASASLEALGTKGHARLAGGQWRVGLIYSLMNGCVAYSGKFYGEVLENPATASPILFPETVFNAPASHLAALLGLDGLVATLVGDSAQFLASFEMARMWLEMDLVDACLVVGAEEVDWLTAAAFRLLARGEVMAEGAGAVLLEKEGTGAEVVQLQIRPMTAAADRAAALTELRHVRQGGFCVDDCTGHVRRDKAWRDDSMERIQPLKILGEGFGASAAWQTVLAAARLREAFGRAGVGWVMASGMNQQAVLLGLRQNRS